MHGLRKLYKLLISRHHRILANDNLGDLPSAPHRQVERSHSRSTTAKGVTEVRRSGLHD